MTAALYSRFSKSRTLPQTLTSLLTGGISMVVDQPPAIGLPHEENAFASALILDIDAGTIVLDFNNLKGFEGAAFPTPLGALSAARQRITSAEALGQMPGTLDVAERRGVRAPHDAIQSRLDFGGGSIKLTCRLVGFVAATGSGNQENDDG